MKKVVRKINRALKSLYNLESKHRAEDFLVTGPPGLQQGALLVHSKAPEDLELGICLGRNIESTLAKFPRGRSVDWSGATLNAFSVASEEISHFHYLVYHASGGRQVSQLELELQGEIDKFLLAFFANASTQEKSHDVFDSLFERFFSQFHWQEGLSAEAKSRYEEAHQMAKCYLRKLATKLNSPSDIEAALKELRRFYRLGAAEKISQIT